MAFKLDWFKHPTEKGMVIGICEDLPDSYCHFTIKKLSSDKFQVIPPTLIHESTTSKLTLRDEETVKDFCNDFLNDNKQTIIRRQIDNMRGSSAETKKNLRYYQDMLDRIIFKENPIRRK